MSDRLTDLAHTDELGRMKARVLGLSIAVAGLHEGSSTTFVAAVQQLAIDASQDMDACAAAFETERQHRIADAGGARG